MPSTFLQSTQQNSTNTEFNFGYGTVDAITFSYTAGIDDPTAIHFFVGRNAPSDTSYLGSIEFTFDENDTSKIVMQRRVTFPEGERGL